MDELSKLGTFAGTMEDEVQSSQCCYEGDGVDFWDPVIIAKELECRVDELPVYYGGDLWNPDGSDFGYSNYYDDQSELSEYEDPRDFFRDEWLDSCEFHEPDGLPVYYYRYILYMNIPLLYIIDLIVGMFILHNNCIPHEYCN